MKKRSAASAPLIPGGSNYTAMHLVFQERSIRVKPSLWSYFLAVLMALPALAFVVVQILLFRPFGEPDLFFLGILLLVFAVCLFLIYLAVRMVWRLQKRCRSIFDLSAQLFCPNGCRPPESDREAFPAIPFPELDALQIVEEHCSTGKNSFDSYELNVVLRDGRRFNLLDHSNKECLAAEAEELSRRLALPLRDAYGDRLSCDSFLALPANIRENLQFGLLALLIFLFFFAAGDGRAWYLTEQSFQWEKCPARVESAGLRKHGGCRTTYSLDFHFRYRYRGKLFTGNVYNFFDLRTSEYALEEIVQRYPPGKKFFCYVNPRSPETAVADRQIPAVWEMLLNSPWTTCFLLMGIFCILKAASQYRLLQRRKNGISIKAGRKP